MILGSLEAFFKGNIEGFANGILWGLALIESDRGI
jgi:hypothetical protein